jgi:hypothetical protein
MRDENKKKRKKNPSAIKEEKELTTKGDIKGKRKKNKHKENPHH